MKNKRFLATSLLIVLLSAARAWAGHVVWVDYSKFNLKEWDSVNGNNPPKTSDLEAIKKLIIAKVSEDYATFDITITTSKPANGRYTRVKVFGKSVILSNGDRVFGCGGGDCGTGIGSWNDNDVTESFCEIYAGTLTVFGEFTGSNATTARIANSLSGTVSHEVGHILGLYHCHAADDVFTVGCDEEGTRNVSLDKNAAEWHIMSSGASWGTTMEAKASNDRFFSKHSERRKLASALQLRNHFAPLANVNGGKIPKADLTYGRLSSPDVMKWYVRLSSGSDFGGYSEWSDNAGNAADIFLTGDVHNDGRADLVYGRIQSPTQVSWYVRKSNGNGFSGYNEWASDAGDAGDIFRLADVNSDGQADLVYGRPLDQSTVRWYVRKSDGTSFGKPETWADDGGSIGNLFFLADADADGDADLVYSRAITKTEVRWWVRRSNGSKFGEAELWHSNGGDKGDLMYVGDADGDGDADLVYGRVYGGKGVAWYFRPSNGSEFGDVKTWANDAGDAGDLFRLGDTTGDGMLDLMYGRPIGISSFTDTPDLTQVRWYGRSSKGTGFNPVSTWADHAGNDGDCFP